MNEICDASNAQDLRSAIIAACAMLLTFAAVAVPVPLYAEYKIALSLTDADISLTMVSYLIGVLTILFIGGSLSDALGRRPLVAAALLFGALACGLYIWLPNGIILQVARMMQGVSCGLTMSATSAFVLDCTSQRYRTFGTTIASTGCLIGMMIGSLGIGIYATFSRDYIPMFAVLIALMTLNVILLPLHRKRSRSESPSARPSNRSCVSRRTFARYSRLPQDAISRHGAPACSSNRCQPLPP